MPPDYPRLTLTFADTEIMNKSQIQGMRTKKNHFPKRYARQNDATSFLYPMPIPFFIFTKFIHFEFHLPSGFEATCHPPFNKFTIFPQKHVFPTLQSGVVRFEVKSAGSSFSSFSFSFSLHSRNSRYTRPLKLQLPSMTHLR